MPGGALEAKVRKNVDLDAKTLVKTRGSLEEGNQNRLQSVLDIAAERYFKLNLGKYVKFAKLASEA